MIGLIFYRLSLSEHSGKSLTQVSDGYMCTSLPLFNLPFHRSHKFYTLHPGDICPSRWPNPRSCYMTAHRYWDITIIQQCYLEWRHQSMACPLQCSWRQQPKNSWCHPSDAFKQRAQLPRTHKAAKLSWLCEAAVIYHCYVHNLHSNMTTNHSLQTVAHVRKTKPLLAYPVSTRQRYGVGVCSLSSNSLIRLIHQIWPWCMLQHVMSTIYTYVSSGVFHS